MPKEIATSPQNKTAFRFVRDLVYVIAGLTILTFTVVEPVWRFHYWVLDGFLQACQLFTALSAAYLILVFLLKGGKASKTLAIAMLLSGLGAWHMFNVHGIVNYHDYIQGTYSR